MEQIIQHTTWCRELTKEITVKLTETKKKQLQCYYEITFTYEIQYKIHLHIISFRFTYDYFIIFFNFFYFIYYDNTENKLTELQVYSVIQADERFLTISSQIFQLCLYWYFSQFHMWFLFYELYWQSLECPNGFYRDII